MAEVNFRNPERFVHRPAARLNRASAGYFHFPRQFVRGQFLTDYRWLRGSPFGAFRHECRGYAADGYGIPHVVNQPFPVITHPDQAVGGVIHRVRDREVKHGRIGNGPGHIPRAKGHFEPPLVHGFHLGRDTFGGVKAFVPFAPGRKGHNFYATRGAQLDGQRAGGRRGAFVFLHDRQLERGGALGRGVGGFHQGVAQGAEVKPTLSRSAGYAPAHVDLGVFALEQSHREFLDGRIFRDGLGRQFGAPGRYGRAGYFGLALHLNPERRRFRLQGVDHGLHFGPVFGVLVGVAAVAPFHFRIHGGHFGLQLFHPLGHSLLMFVHFGGSPCCFVGYGPWHIAGPEGHLNISTQDLPFTIPKIHAFNRRRGTRGGFPFPVKGHSGYVQVRIVGVGDQANVNHFPACRVGYPLHAALSVRGRSESQPQAYVRADTRQGPVFNLLPCPLPRFGFRERHNPKDNPAFQVRPFHDSDGVFRPGVMVHRNVQHPVPKPCPVEGYVPG